MNNWPVCGGRLSAKCLPTVQKYSFEKLQISFRSVTIQLLLHSFAICGLILRYGVRGVACQKQRLGPKLEGGWARGASKKFGTPYVFLQPLKLATSNLVHNLGMGLAYQKHV